MDTAEDTSGDTAGDTGIDTIIPDGPDTPPDVEPDGEPPPVECSLVNDADFTFPSSGSAAININSGCREILGVMTCRIPGLWLAPFVGRIAVIYGGEENIGGAGVRFAGEVIVPGDLDSLSFNPFTSPYGLGNDVHLFGASLVRRTGNELFLLYGASYRPVPGDPRVSNIEVLGVATEDGGHTMTHNTNRLITGGVPESAGFAMSPMGVQSPVTGLYHIFYLLAQEGSGDGPEPTQLMGAWLPGGALWADSLDSYTDFYLLLGDGMIESYFITRPDCHGGEVVVPWLYVEVDPSVALRSGLTIIDVSGDLFEGYTRPSEAEFVGTGTYTSNLAGVWTDYDSYAMAALSSSSAHTWIGVHPPYEANVGVAPGFVSTTTVTGSSFETVNEPFLRDMDNFDFNDSLVLHDQPHRLLYHVQPFFYTTGDSETHVHVFPYSLDGMPAGPPYVLNTGQYLPPAFDATIHPESGHIFVAWMRDTGAPDDMARVPGWTIAEIACE